MTRPSLRIRFLNSPLAKSGKSLKSHLRASAEGSPLRARRSEIFESSCPGRLTPGPYSDRARCGCDRLLSDAQVCAIKANRDPAQRRHRWRWQADGDFSGARYVCSKRRCQARDAGAGAAAVDATMTSIPATAHHAMKVARPSTGPRLLSAIIANATFGSRKAEGVAPISRAVLYVTGRYQKAAID